MFKSLESPYVDRIWLWVYYNKIPMYPIFYLLKGDYVLGLRFTDRCCRAATMSAWLLSVLSTGYHGNKPVLAANCLICHLFTVLSPLQTSRQSSRQLQTLNICEVGFRILCFVVCVCVWCPVWGPGSSFSQPIPPS